MAKLAALAADPVGFTNPSDGKQIFVPASLIYFEDGAAKFTPPAGMSSGVSDAIGQWLTALAKAGILTPDTQAPPVPAMVITAKDAGAAGNTIVIAISNVRPKPTDASKTIFDATVSETNTHEGLTPATLKATAGTAAGGGEKPGLVFVSSSGAPVQPKDGAYALTGDPAKADVLKADGTAGGFELTAKAAGPDGALTEATVSDAADPDAPGSFTLTVVWEKSAAGIEASELQTQFAYEITVAAPPGGTLAAPAAGAYILSGGAEAQTAAKASASIPAGS
jgi:hypothetical protein